MAYLETHMKLIRQLGRDIIQEWLQQFTPVPTSGIVTEELFREDMHSCTSPELRKIQIKKWLLLTHPEQNPGHVALFRMVHKEKRNSKGHKEIDRVSPQQRTLVLSSAPKK